MLIKYISLVLYLPYIYYLKRIKKSFHEIHYLLKSKICGTDAFSAMISYASPYSGSINPIVEQFDENTIKCSIKENIFLGNPFNSIHALALANLGELTSGLLMTDYLKFSKQKGIITKITIEYHKKARGKITAICDIKSLHKGIIKSELYDEKNELICTVFCTWTIKKRDSYNVKRV